jgi:chemotaxis protein MotB
MAGNAVVRPIVVKKITIAAHGGHHGGAWKVAYADFVTAMMAFFLLMWLLGATTEKQRKALADYFAPTLVTQKQDSAGGSGFFGGDAIVSADKYPNRAGQTGTRTMTIPRDAKGGPKEASGRQADAACFEQLRQSLAKRLENDKALKRHARSIRFTETQEGLRIDLVDEADFAMFLIGSDVLTAEARQLLPAVVDALNAVPNEIKIRGHTDAAQFTRDPARNNWALSGSRAESTRRSLAGLGVAPNRFKAIEGVADREPYSPKAPYAANNRRMSITLGWSAPRQSSGNIRNGSTSIQ